MFRINKIITLLLCSIVFSSFGQVKYVNEFLNLGVGARALGMGSAHLTNLSDVTAGYWAPSSLVHIEDNIEIAGMHNEYFAGIAAYDYGAMAFQIDDNSAAAVTFLRFGVDDIPNTLDLVDANGNFNYDRITTFSSTDNALLISYARKLNIPGLSVGGNVKIIYRQVGDFASAIGFGLDASATYNKEKWKFAAIARDVTSTFSAWRFNTEDLEEVFIQTGNEIPENSLEVALPRLITGAGYDYAINEQFGLYPEANLELTFDGKRNVLIGTNVFSADVRLGIEADYQDMFFLRLGVQNIQKESFISGNDRYTFQPNLGVGFKFKKVAIDYALSDIGNQSAALYSNVISLRIGLNKRN
jgi:hypothetical protein